MEHYNLKRMIMKKSIILLAMVLGAFTANAQSVVEGTKLTDNPKDFTLRVRLDKGTLQKLDEVCKDQGSNRSEVVRNGIEEQYQRIKK
mgnify:CR=1 FL=1